MLKITVNEKWEMEADASSARLNGKDFPLDLKEIKKNCFHIIRNNKTYTAEVLESNFPEKKFVIRINGNRYELSAKDRYDELLHRLGMDNASAKKVHDLKAPMPGLVLDIRVKEGDEIKKGDVLVVLEAMKMENILKSAGDGKVSKVIVSKGDKVEKNQVLVQLG